MTLTQPWRWPSLLRAVAASPHTRAPSPPRPGKPVAGRAGRGEQLGQLPRRRLPAVAVSCQSDDPAHVRLGLALVSNLILVTAAL